MIKKIKRIRNLGLVFADYSWNWNLSGYQLPDFKRFNLIYGWTATGKTTLSKLFDAIESGYASDMPSLEYEIEDDENNKYRQNESFGKKLRVFNEDYVEKNLTIQEGKAKAITLVLGDANKELVQQIKSDKEQLKKNNSDLTNANEKRDQKIKAKSKTFTEIAKTIYVAISGGAIRTYRRDNAESEFSTIKNKEVLSDKDSDMFSIVVKQSSKPTIDPIKKVAIETEEGGEKELSAIIKDVMDKTEILLSQTVESQIIERLKSNQDISNWVETGLSIHADHKSVNCEFCGQVLPEERLLELSKHFSEADKKLKQQVDSLITNCSDVYSLIDNTECPDKARLYDELQADYENDCTIHDQEKINLLSSIQTIKDILKSKKARTTEAVALDKEIDIDMFTKSLSTIKGHIDKHNKKTSDFENAKTEAINKLKKHYLSTIFDEVKKLEKEIKAQEETIGKLNNGNPETPDEPGIFGLNKRIVENQAKISSTHKACEDINKTLATFLGRDELVFEPHRSTVLDDKGHETVIEDGYVIKRNGELAENLSTGEKTAIAFVYFTIHLNDQDFDLTNGIVVIDDPVSSLDSNSLFQAFAFLRNAVKDARQVFILTHNFDFLKLLLHWFKNMNRGKDSSYYMIKNCHMNSIRCAYLDKMDKELWKYESEYHYLFKILKEFESDGTIAQAYPIPNLARKVLDTFLLFRVPSGEGMYSKLEKIRETTDFDKNKLTAIYKFTYDQSHITGSGFDPALVPETQKNVKYLLEMIEEIFPEHYSILQASI